MKIACYLLLPLFLLTLNTFAQDLEEVNDRRYDLPQVIPPSPTVASLMRFEEVPVDHYSGSPGISIPIFEKKLSNSLDFHLALKYNTSGVRVDERSGWTGTGWSLEGGGAVSRTVMGLPDEESTNKKKGTFHTGFYEFTLTEVSNYTPQQLEQWQEFVWKTANGQERYDAQADLFQFSFAGHSGRFIVVNDNGTLTPKVLSSTGNIKISLDHTANFEITGFELTDPQGNKFLFDVRETSTSLPRKSGTSQGEGNISDNVFSYDPSVFTSSWNLSKISTSSGEELCSILYKNVTEGYQTPVNRETNTLMGTVSPNPFIGSGNSYNSSIAPPKVLNMWSDISVVSKKIEKVLFKDLSSVTVNTLAGHPEYNGQGPGCKLGSIEIKHPSGAVFKTFELDYFTNAHNRLFLSEVREEAGSLSLPYVFSYHNPSELPGFGDGKKDKWGYYNGNNNDLPSPNPFSRHVHSEKIKSGVLKEITYPTGGKKEFNFEPNSFSYLGDGLIDVHTIPQNRKLTSSVKSFTADVGIPANQTGPFPGDQIFYLDNDQPVNILYTTSSPISQAIQYANHRLSLQKVDFLPGSEVTYDPCFSGPQPFPGINSFDVANAVGINEYTIKGHNNPSSQVMNLSAGWYLVRVYTPQSYFVPPDQGPTVLSVEATVAFSGFCYNTREMLGGGLRIKDIVFSDYGQQQEKTSFSYHSKTGDSSVVNPDSLSLPLSSGSFDGTLMMSRTYEKPLELYLSNPCVITPFDFKVKKSLNEVFPQMTKGNYVGYKHISVAKQGNGRTDYTFTSPMDHPSYPSSYYLGENVPYFEAPVADQDYKRGLMIKSEVYNGTNKIIKESEKLFDFITVSTYGSFFTFDHLNNPYDQFFSTYYYFENNLPQSDCYIAPGSPIHMPPATYIGIHYFEHTFNKALLKEERSKEHFYEGALHRELNLLKTYSYNPVNHKVKEENTYLVDNSQNEHYQSRYYYPVGTALPVAYDANVKNNLVGANKVNEVLVKDTYKDGVRIERVVNRYKEFNPGQLLPELIEASKSNAPLESRVAFDAYDVYDNPRQLSLSGGPKVTYLYGYNGQFPVARVENANYLQVLATGVNTTVLNNPLSSQGAKLTELDKVRNGLPGAMVTTYTYEPLKGVTTITDPKGARLTYHYDALGRLAHIKDDQGNYLEEYQYHYRAQ